MPTILEKYEASEVEKTDQLQSIATIMGTIELDHQRPNVDWVYNYVSSSDNSISMRAVYEAVDVFKEAEIITQVDFDI
jgi:Fe2+ or Zn2+ uptake regulation protein